MFQQSVVLLFVAMLVAGCGARTSSRIPPGARKDGGSSATTDGPQWQKDWSPWRDDYYSFRDRGPVKLDRAIKPDRPVKVDGPTKCVQMGLSCGAAGSRCCSGMKCTKMPTGTSICTRTCTPDNPRTPLVNEDTCPNAARAEFTCSRVAASGSGGYACLKGCTPRLGRNDCGKGVACHPRSTVYTGKVDRAACVYQACTGAKECPVYLNRTCSVGGPASQCSGLGSGAYCAPEDGNALSGRCARPGRCDAASGLCTSHTLGKATAKVGSPCTSDLQCGNTMRCRTSYTSGGAFVTYPNGYCVVEGCTFGSTLIVRRCPAGSTCSLLYWGGVCFKTCDPKSATSCRNHAKDRYGDYECRAWNNLTYAGGKRITASPVCEPGSGMPCAMYSTIKCSHVGLLPGNPTQMECRHPKTGKVLPQNDPSGTCLDTTASGKK